MSSVIESAASGYYIGLMSGTSMDGVDAVLAGFSGATPQALAHAACPYPATLRTALLALQTPGHDEITRSQLLALELAQLYAEAVEAVLRKAGLAAGQIAAVGCHGQTVRHAPHAGYTVQLNAPARLAELCGIDVVADFRSRDIAAGGQGAPLVPAFHQAVFASTTEARVVLNIGGIANLTRLVPGQPVCGFDTGPGNMLLDAWCQHHLHRQFDENGAWAAQGQPLPALLERLLAEPYLALPAPKSTGRDLFSLDWLAQHLDGSEQPADVARTLTLLTARSAADAILACTPGVAAVYVCGGGAFNPLLLADLTQALGPAVRLAGTDELGVPAQWVEGLAFAWLARACLCREAGNLPAVTGAAGLRVLGAVHPR